MKLLFLSGSLLAMCAVLAAQSTTYPLIGQIDAPVGSNDASAGWAGDVDGDGTVDIAASTTAGSAVYSGADLRLLYMLSAPVIEFDDVDGDGSADLLQPAGGTTVNIVSGRDGTTLFSVNEPGVIAIFLSAVTLDDIDGDGVLDFCTGLYNAPMLGSPGRVFGYSGATGAQLFALNEGSLVAPAGDVNGDGMRDFVTHSGSGPIQPVEFRSGVDGAVLFDLQSLAFPPADPPAALDDIDGDGCDDFCFARAGTLIDVVTSPCGGGTPVVLYTVPFTAQTGEPVTRLAGVGDVDGDGDGAGDFAATAIEHIFIPGSSGPGSVHVFSGPSGAPIANFAGDYGGEGFGGAVAGGRDLNRDGLPDMLIGTLKNPFATDPAPARIAVRSVGGADVFGVGSSGASLSWTAGAVPDALRGDLRITSGLPATSVLLGVSLAAAPTFYPLPSVPVDISLAPGNLLGVVTVQLDSNGAWGTELNLKEPALAGTTLFTQVFDMTPAPLRPTATNGLALAFVN